MEGTPAKKGYSMPAEWAPHKATWLSWPKDPLTFPPRIINRVEETYCKMVHALQPGEKVNILVDDGNQEEHARRVLAKNGAGEENLVFRKIKSTDVWMRDYGPTFLVSRAGGSGAVRFIFNAWGNKYDELLEDNRTGDAVAEAAAAEKPGLEIFRPGIVMEGGSIDVNGRGALLTTEQCLLNRNRNPGLGKAKIEEYLKEYLGVSQVIWLKKGIEGDDTDGHVDDFCRFASEKAALLCEEKSRGDPNFAPLRENRKILEDSLGLEIVPLSMPSPIIDHEENRRLPASHANFYIGNRAVLLPIFGGKSDRQAIEALQGCFPAREIVPIRCNELVYGYGGMHCVTQQEPSSPAD
jgi:agmatine deiminase